MSAVENASKVLSPTDPLIYDPSVDHQEWRRNLARWVDNQDIVDLLAVGKLIAVVTRLIYFFNRDKTCACPNNEDLSAFVPRFRELAADHPIHAVVATNSQIGEILAITLLSNSNISEETLSNAKMQLLSMAKARTSTASRAVLLDTKIDSPNSRSLKQRKRATFIS